MEQNNKLTDCQNFLDKHNDYIVVMNDYSGTEIFKEIILFMDLEFPEWNSNKGIGTWAGEFVLAAIQNLEYLNEKTEYSSLQKMKDIYISLVEDYNIYKRKYSFTFKDFILNEFMNEYDEFFNKNEHLPENDFNALYDELYSTYKFKTLEKVTYNFIDMVFPDI